MIEVDHDYGENRNNAVVRVTLVFFDTRHLNCWGTINSNI